MIGKHDVNIFMIYLCAKCQFIRLPCHWLLLLKGKLYKFSHCRYVFGLYSPNVPKNIVYLSKVYYHT
jgi:hypothetical protein